LNLSSSACRLGEWCGEFIYRVCPRVVNAPHLGLGYSSHRCSLAIPAGFGTADIVSRNRRICCSQAPRTNVQNEPVLPAWRVSSLIAVSVRDLILVLDRWDRGYRGCCSSAIRRACRSATSSSARSETSSSRRKQAFRSDVFGHPIVELCHFQALAGFIAIRFRLNGSPIISVRSVFLLRPIGRPKLPHLIASNGDEDSKQKQGEHLTVGNLGHHSRVFYRMRPALSLI